MGLFSRKPKVNVEEFCQEFYDSQIFHAIIAEQDPWLGFVEVTFNSIVEADQSFAKIDKLLFQQEMTALRVELFGLVWLHHFKRDQYTLPQIIFTKSYLEQNGRLEIWDIMGEYNNAIARSSTSEEVVSGERMLRAVVAGLNQLRMDLFEKWVKAGVDDKCAARLANRTGTDVAWSKQVTVNYLTARLAKRLGCDVNNVHHEALFRLSGTILGLYNGAIEAIKSANLKV